MKPNDDDELFDALSRILARVPLCRRVACAACRGSGRDNFEPAGCTECRGKGWTEHALSETDRDDFVVAELMKRGMRQREARAAYRRYRASRPTTHTVMEKPAERFVLKYADWQPIDVTGGIDSATYIRRLRED